jgi:hypothetical protein
MAKATLVTASRITVEERFSFESEKIRSAMNFWADKFSTTITFSLKTIPGSLIAQGLSGLNDAKIQTFSENASDYQEKNQIFMTLSLTTTT